MKRIFLLMLSLAVAAGVVSCKSSKSDEPDTPQSLTLDTESITAPSAGLTQTVQVTSNGSWKVACDASWCKTDKSSGSGNGSFTVTIAENTESVDRTATVSVTVGDVAKTVAVTQYASSYTLPTLLEFGRDQEDKTIFVNTDGAWSISLADVGSGTSWLTVAPSTQGTGTTLVTLTAAANNTGADRSLKLTLTKSGQGTDITVTQSGGQLAQPVVQLSDGADTLKVTWAAVPGASGYSVEAYNGANEVASANVTATRFDLNNFPEFAEGPSQYIGPVQIVVKALTSNPDIFSQSEPTAVVHSHYDLSSGDGTSAASAFVITKPRHLNNVRSCRTGFFRQESNLDMSCYANFVPIPYWEGVYDGNNKEISNISITRNVTNGGLFGQVNLNADQGTGGPNTRAELKNITLRNPKVVCTLTTGTNNVGALVGNYQGVNPIVNCHTIGGSVTGSNNNVAGLIGMMLQTTASVVVENCSNEGTSVTTPEAAGSVGGLIGYMEFTDLSHSGTVRNCFNTGTVTGFNALGGIVGDVNGNVILSHCYNSGTIDQKNLSTTTGASAAGSIMAGGITSRLRGTTTQAPPRAEYCYNTGEVRGAYLLGGIAGRTGNVNAAIVSCYNQGQITITEFIPAAGTYINGTSAGGILGTAQVVAPNTAIVQNCYNTGNIVSSTYNDRMGAIVGCRNANDNNGLISGCRITDNYFLSTLSVANAVGENADLLTDGKKSDADLKKQATYNGWDFTSVWQIAEGTGYPTLR